MTTVIPRVLVHRPLSESTIERTDVYVTALYVGPQAAWEAVRDHLRRTGRTGLAAAIDSSLYHSVPPQTPVSIPVAGNTSIVELDEAVREVLG